MISFDYLTNNNFFELHRLAREKPLVTIQPFLTAHCHLTATP